MHPNAPPAPRHGRPTDRGTIAGYGTCGTTVDDQDAVAPSATICLKRTTGDGELRVRLYETRAIVEVCAHTEQAGIKQGCDLAWRGIRFAF
jgi:hypothetical protein